MSEVSNGSLPCPSSDSAASLGSLEVVSPQNFESASLAEQANQVDSDGRLQAQIAIEESKSEPVMPLSQSLENMGVENGPKEQAFMQNRS